MTTVITDHGCSLAERLGLQTVRGVALLLALAGLLAGVAGCDAPPQLELQERSGEADGPRRRELADCRDAYFCARDCLGAAFLEGEPATESVDACAARCEPSDSVEAHHWGWWVAALEQTCEDDWTDECVWAAAVPSLGEGLSGITLDACLRPRQVAR